MHLLPRMPHGPTFVTTLALSWFAGAAIAQNPRWTTARVLVGRQTAMAFDSARGKTVLYGGYRNAVFSDTWEYDGVAWDRRPASSGPGPRWGHAMAYDAARRQVVLFGGSDGNNLRNDTWTWDGDRWSQRTPAVVPATGYVQMMCYDSQRARVVLLGPQNGTWEWDGSTWQLRANGPATGTWESIAYDPVRQRTVLFASTTGGQPGQTWEYDGIGWTLRGNVNTPTTALGATLAFDAGSNRIVMFGGGFNGAFAGTSEYDGTTWQSPAGGPAGRYHASLVFDDRRGRLVLFGGIAGTEPPADTWERNGQAWTQTVRTSPPKGGLMAVDEVHGTVVMQVSGNTSNASDTWLWNGDRWTRHVGATPPALTGSATAWDGTQVVWFGGSNPAFATNATWTWNGSWTQRAPTVSPSPRQGHAMAFDRARQRVVLFGGSDNGPLFPSGNVRADTWEWDGSTWIPRTPTTSPAARWRHRMAYDEVRQRIVLCGGQVLAGWLLGDTWEWDGATWAQCSAGSAPVLNALPPMAWDPTRQAVVMATNTTPVLAPVDVWQWNGTTWNQVATGPAPTNWFADRDWVADPGRDRMLLVGDPDEETHWFGPLVPAAVQTVGSACPASSLTLTSTESYLGNARFALELLGTAPNALCVFGWSLGTQPQAIGPCTLYLDNPMLLTAAVSDGFGIAHSTPLPLAAVSTWRGLSLYAQAAVLDPNGPLGLGFTALRVFTKGD